MTGWQIALHVLAACLIGSHAYSEAGKYFVTAPETALAGSPYTLTVQVFDTALPVSFSAYIEANQGYNYSLHQVIYGTVTPVVSRTVLPGSVATLTIQVPENTYSNAYRHNYRLHVRGTGGLQLEETYSVSITPYTANIFIQTDKSTYAPGETVTFKTFGLYKKDLTPYTGAYGVILKAGGIELNKWTSTSGLAVNTFHYELDAHTVMGTWTITTISSVAQNSQQSFSVGHKHSDLTISPARGSGGIYRGEITIQNAAIDVKIHLPKTMNSSTDLTGSFEAMYPMGVGVKGTAKITLSSAGTTTQTIQFHGNGTFTFPYRSLRYSDTQVTVTVTEEETGIMGQGSSKVSVYERDVKIEFTEQTPAVYKPKLPFTVYLKISNHADEPLQIPADSMYRTVHVYGVGHYLRQTPGSGFRSSTYSGTYPILAKKLTLPDSGLFSLDLDIPDDVTSIDVVVTFQGLQKKLTLQQAELTEGDRYLQMYLMGSVPTVTQTQSGDVKFRVLSSQRLTDLTVETVSRGNIVSAVQPTLTSKGTTGVVYSAEFSLTLTWDMTPVTEVIAYYMVEKDHTIQEVISDSMALNVHSLLDDTISVTSDEQHVTPGQVVTLRVQTRPGANVGILVEESNGASGQEVTPQSVENTIQSNNMKPLKEAQATTSKYGSGSFAAAHLLLMSGSAIYRHGQTTPISQTAYTDHSNTKIPSTVYMDTSTSGADGRTTFAVRLPKSVTTWSVTGFVFDDVGHVSVVHQPLQIEAVYEVYGELLGPDHVVSGEQVVLTAYAHNARDVDSQVTLTLKPNTLNVQMLNVSQKGVFHATSQPLQQIVTVPAMNSKQVFFAVTSPVGTPIYATNAEVELILSSGDSKQTVPYSYTVVPQGMEKTYTFSDMTRVDGQVDKSLTVAQAYPAQALPGTITTRVTVQQNFSDLLLPLALLEEDVMEEGTGMAAIVHFSLPVLLAKYRRDMAPQLRKPIAKGYQRLMSFVSGHHYRNYPSRSSYNDWLDITAMRMMAEARQHIYVPDIRITDVLYNYFDSYNTNDNILFTSRFQNGNILGSIEALEAYYSIAVQDLPQHVYITRGNDYNKIIKRVHNFLKNTSVTLLSTTTDTVQLSYLALACVRYGYSANAHHFLARLMALQDASGNSTDEIFWNSNNNDSFKYYGDWLPAHHVAETADLVTAANALQVLVFTGQTAEAERVARWLFRQRHGNGLFKTAWDTLAATEALLMYENRPNASPVQLNNFLTSSQSRQWLAHGQPTHFSASGHGEVFSQVEVRYHVKQNVGDTPYEVIPVVLDENLHHFKLMICSRWLLLDKNSGATVQEVIIPTGFMADTSQLSTQSGVVNVIQRNSTAFTLYINQVERDSTCYTLDVNRIYNVAHTSPGYIFTRGLDKPEYQDITTYQTRRLTESSLCDLCPTCCS